MRFCCSLTAETGVPLEVTNTNRSFGSFVREAVLDQPHIRDENKHAERCIYVAVRMPEGEPVGRILDIKKVFPNSEIIVCAPKTGPGGQIN